MHSPLTASIVRRLQQLEADHPGLSRDRFIKVGDSITRSPKFLACLGGSPRINDPTLAATLDLLRASPIDLFQRESLSAENGWSAWQPLAGNPPPLLRELSTVRGRFALVMLGTNDIETSRVTTFARRWMRLIDSLLEQGLVPLVSTIPERRDRLESRLKVPRFNAAIRAIAQERRVPLIDLHHALSGLPGEGLTSDGIHPSVHSVGGLVKPCDFSPRGLRHGFNVRNLISLEALHRARSALNGELVEPAPLPGAGHSEAFPAPVRELPSVRVLELAPGGPTALRCSDEHSHSRRGSQAQSPSIALSIPLAEPTRLEILALSALDGRALDISLYSASADAPCTQTRRGFLRTAPLPKGTYSLLVAGPAGRALVALLRGRSGAS